LCEHCSPQLHTDGYPLLSLGPWASEKLHYLDYYAALFTQGMKNQWETTAYIDLFAGPGLCMLGNGVSHVVEGSPLVALRQRTPFTHYVFVDTDKGHAQALDSRSRGLAPNSAKLVRVGDCNDASVLADILAFIPAEALCLAFIDPFSWKIHFDTVSALTRSRRVDILLVFQLGGIKRAVEARPASLNRFFGDEGAWQTVYRSALPRRDTRAMLDYYRRRLSTLGYLKENYPSEVAVVNTKNVPIYYLVHATRHPRGQDFWRKAIQRTADGKRKLPGIW